MGHFVRALGNIGDKETENEVLLLEYDVPHSRFSDAVLGFLPKMPWSIPENVNTIGFKKITLFCDEFSYNRFSQYSGYRRKRRS